MIDAIPFPDEEAHLVQIRELLGAAEQDANANVGRIDKEYMDAKRYMSEYRGEIDPHEMFQNELALRDIDRSGAFAVGVWNKLTKLRESPYFARIDFKPSDEEQVAKHYIGRFGFSYRDELLIFDWRAPVSSMFYDCEVGPAGYDAPMGRIDGDLTLKRQFKIANGVMQFALESSVNIQDDVLQRELSHTSDKKMKSIITTIQKEQNKIIRSEKAGTMIIQGVAGSGKTSIALHRIAFLLYRFKDTLAAKNVAILSPNKVFGDYISTVLPELGEEPISELSFWELALTQLGGTVQVERDKDATETDDVAWAGRVQFKSTLQFARQLEAFVREVPALVFEPVDFSFGPLSASADWIRSRYAAYKNHPVKKRLVMMADDIVEKFACENFAKNDMPKVRHVIKSLTAMLKMNSTLALYKHFYRWLGRPDLLVQPKKNTIEWADVYPMLYLYAALEGLEENRLVRHLVIDEMQDYTPIQYAVINLLFPCSKTILGDYGQLVNPNHLHSLSDLKELYSGASCMELCKSYRSTYEIISFAKKIKPIERLEAMERHGEPPAVIACADKQEELTRIKEKMDSFLAGDSVSLGIILKTATAAKELYDLIAADYKVQLITADSVAFANGITVTSIAMSKGLEFDEVVIPSVDDATYRTEHDQNLLYIACTRAMHRLTLLHAGIASKFLGQSKK